MDDYDEEYSENFDEEENDNEMDDEEEDVEEIEFDVESLSSTRFGRLVAPDGHEVIQGTVEDLARNPSLHSLLILNKAQVLALKEFRKELEKKLFANQRLQEMLSKKGVGGTPVMSLGSSSGLHLDPSTIGKINQNVSIFCAPYFRDKRGFHPPPNEDTKRKRNGKEINQALIRPPPRSWMPQDIQDLNRAVVHQKVKPMILSLLEEIEELQTLRANRRDEKEREQREKMETSRESTSSGVEEDEDIVIKEKITKLYADIEVLKKSDAPSLDECKSWSDEWMNIAFQLNNSDYDDIDCRLKWLNEAHPDINNDDFSQEEVEKMMELAVETNLDFDLMAQRLSLEHPTTSNSKRRIRTAWKVASYYQSNLNRDVKRMGPLSSGEKLLLHAVIHTCRPFGSNSIPWAKVKSFMTGRTTSQLKLYWQQEQQKHSLKKGDWSPLEDKVLTVAVHYFGKTNWVKVAYYVFGRTHRQCRERYIQQLSIADRQIGDWTEEEDAEILRRIEDLQGPQWTELAKFFPNRNPKQVMCRYEVLKKKMDCGDYSHPKTTKPKCFHTRTSAEIEAELAHILIDPKTTLEWLEEGRIDLMRRFEKSQKLLERKTKGLDDQGKEVDAKITEMFSLYTHVSRRGTLETRPVNRPKLDQIVWHLTQVTTEEVLRGRELQATNPLSCVMKDVFQKMVAFPKDGSPGIFPPNRVTLRGLQGLLLQKDFLATKLVQAGISPQAMDDQLNKIIDTPAYNDLLDRFLSLFLWPAVCSLQNPPLRPPSEPSDAPTSDSNNPDVVRRGRRPEKKKKVIKGDDHGRRLVEIKRESDRLIDNDKNSYKELSQLFTRISSMTEGENHSETQVSKITEFLFDNHSIKSAKKDQSKGESNQQTEAAVVVSGKRKQGGKGSRNIGPPVKRPSSGRVIKPPKRVDE